LSLHTEIKSLFHPNIIRQSTRLKPEWVDALAVNKAARALLRLKGQPTEQVELVRQLQPSTATALCRWLADPPFWGLVGGITQH
jgi:hypothetical protein